MEKANPIGTFADAMASTGIDPLQRSVVVALAELSCSPWKFDVLWDLWSPLEIPRERFPDLAQRILRKDLGALLACSAAAFDDLTIFADIVGDPHSTRPHSRPAYRAAYLTIRPMIFRLEVDALPRLPHAVTKAEYTERLMFVASMLTSELLEQVVAVLEDAASGYEVRGKSQGGVLCRQNAELLRTFAGSGLLQAGPRALVQQSFRLLFSVQGAVLHNEIIVQWWRLFDQDFRRSLQPAESADQEAAEAIAGLRQNIERLSPFAWLNEERPGVESALMTLSLLRLSAGLGIPTALTLFPSEYLTRCQERVEFLRRDWKQEPKPPDEARDALVDALVATGHQARQRSFDSKPQGEQWRGGWAEAAILQLDITAKAARRARNELSEEQYARELCALEKQVRSTPIIIDVLIHLASLTQLQQPSLVKAILEAARILAPFTGNPNIVDAAMRTRVRRPDEDRQFAEQFARQGRPDLAILALRNAGATLTNSGQYEEALEALGGAWELLGRIREGALRVPKSTVFDFAEATRRVAEGRARALGLLGRHDECLRIIEEAFTITAGAYQENASGSLLGADPGATAVLYFLAADALDNIGRQDEAREALDRGREHAEKLGQHDLSALSHMKFATFAYRAHDTVERLRRLNEAQKLANRHRRSFPFEFEKIQAFEKLQLAYSWAGEALIEEGRPWDALSSFEGLRSRAFLDLLGFSAALEIPDTLGGGLREEGERILQTIRSIAFPGGGDPFYTINEQWLRNINTLDKWLEQVSPTDDQYASIVGGSAMSPDAIRLWARSVERSTAVVFWFLGETYSYQAVLRGTPGVSAPPPDFRKVKLTLGEVRAAAAAWQQAVRNRMDPPAGLFEFLSQLLLGPVADLLEGAAVIYLCPSQELNALPIASLSLGGQPLSTVAEVATVPTLSVLRVLQALKRADRPGKHSAVYGPQFEELTAPVAALLGTRPEPTLFSDGTHDPSIRIRDCRLLHLACHGYHDEKDPWESGFSFSDADLDARLTGRTVSRWRLAAQLVVLEACDTRRQVTSATEDGFGMGRFLHIAGVPSLLLTDWEIRSDISSHFMDAFYRGLGPALERTGPLRGYGAAYRGAVDAVRQRVGDEHPFLWAPFSIVGVIE